MHDIYRWTFMRVNCINIGKMQITWWHKSCIMYHVCLCVVCCVAAFRRSKYSVAREIRTRLGLHSFLKNFTNSNILVKFVIHRTFIPKQTSNLSAGTTATITATTTRAHNIGTINDYGASGYGAQCGWNGTHQSIVRKFQPAKCRQISQCGRNGTSELIAIQTQLPKFSYISQC